MKKNLFPIIVFLCLTQTLSTSAQDWHLTGNADATVGSQLGTTNFIPLRLTTNNVERITITSSGKVGINHPTSLNILALKLGAASVPVSSWYKPSTLIAGFGETTDGNAEMVIGMASATPTHRSVLYGKRARGTLAIPAALSTGDQVFSVLGSAYSGTTFIDAAGIDFVVDGTVTTTSVPERIAFATGSSAATRVERLRIGSTGNFQFNNNQLFLQQSTGILAIGTTSPISSSILDIRSTSRGVLLPRMTQAQRDAIVSPTVGLLIYQTNNTQGFYYFNAGWKSVHSSVFDNGLTVTDGGLTATNNIPDGVGVLGIGGGSENSAGVHGDGPVGVTGFGLTGMAGTGLTGVSGSGVQGVIGSSGGGGFCGVCAIGDGAYGLFASSSGGEYAGYFEGNVFSTGSFVTSDSKLKKNITNFQTTALELINKLQPKSYEFRQDGNFKKMNLPTGMRYGIMAEELEKVLPELVKETKFNTVKPTVSKLIKNDRNPVAQTIQVASTEKGEIINFKAVNYTELIPILVKALQEVNEKVIKLEEQNQQLAEIIKALDHNGGNIMSNSGAWMKQNTPNPFNGSTQIEYFVPTESRNARIVMTNAKGQELKYWNLEKGKGTLAIPVGTLSAGTYNYTLVVDGITTSTKKMIISR